MEKKKRGRPPGSNVKKIVEQIEKTIEKKEKATPKLEFVSSGSTWLDLALGGGFPIGKIVNIVGNYSTGKTLLVCENVYKAILKYGESLNYFYDNCEEGMTFDTEALYGYSFPDIENSSYSVEQWEANLDAKLKESLLKNRFIYIVDSLDGLTYREEQERSESRISATRKGKREIKT